MRKLLETYQNYEPSQKCYLDTKYIKRVFPGIPRLVVSVDRQHIDLQAGSDVRTRSLLSRGLVHLRIEIEGSFHCNLLLLEDDKAYRFEPLSDEHLPAELNDLINEILTEYLDKLGVELFIFDAHPQQTCSNKGLCVAYMIKAGVIATLHPEANISAKFGLDAEEDIKRFATAVEALY